MAGHMDALAGLSDDEDSDAEKAGKALVSGADAAAGQKAAEAPVGSGVAEQPPAKKPKPGFSNDFFRALVNGTAHADVAPAAADKKAKKASVDGQEAEKVDYADLVRHGHSAPAHSKGRGRGRGRGPPTSKPEPVSAWRWGSGDGSEGSTEGAGRGEGGGKGGDDGPPRKRTGLGLAAARPGEGPEEGDPKYGGF
mmetsp:Transcript_23253/g.59374  ORF Transcript_23253/g.59374 Transcript_23253/m.59374 type:complete len:195 (-) Transcript_23253:24-608(-)